MVRPGHVFMTVGSQMPFDRLTHTMAEWSRSQAGRVIVRAQVGDTCLEPAHLLGLDWVDRLSPSDYRQACLQADLLVAHAGMGSVLTAAELDRPLLVMPRRGALRETRNDHQVDTARHLLHLAPGRLWVALDEAALTEALEQWQLARATEVHRTPNPTTQTHTPNHTPIHPLTGAPATPPPQRLELQSHLRRLIETCRPSSA